MVEEEGCWGLDCARAHVCVCVFFPLYRGFWLWLVACGAMIVVAIAIVL